MAILKTFSITTGYILISHPQPIKTYIFNFSFFSHFAILKKNFEDLTKSFANF